MKRVFVIVSFVFVILTNLSAADDLTADNFSKYLVDQEKYESEYPVFLQKGGMLRVGEHSFYLRTNDEWTGFSTVLAGYRFGDKFYSKENQENYGIDLKKINIFNKKK